jgi:hypothetical protein
MGSKSRYLRGSAIAPEPIKKNVGIVELVIPIFWLLIVPAPEKHSSYLANDTWNLTSLSESRLPAR